MGHPVRSKIGLVVWIESLKQPTRNHVCEFGKPASRSHRERENQVSRSEIQQASRFDHATRLRCSAECKPRAEYEQQLPSERIEIPDPGRVGRDVPAEMPC